MTEIGLESTVVDCTAEFPLVLRSGAVTLEHRGPERGFHLGDAPAHRGMVQPQPLGGLAEVSGAGGAQKHPQVVQLRVSNILASEFNRLG